MIFQLKYTNCRRLLSALQLTVKLPGCDAYQRNVFAHTHITFVQCSGISDTCETKRLVKTLHKNVHLSFYFHIDVIR